MSFSNTTAADKFSYAAIHEANRAWSEHKFDPMDQQQLLEIQTKIYNKLLKLRPHVASLSVNLLLEDETLIIEISAIPHKMVQQVLIKLTF